MSETLPSLHALYAQTYPAEAAHVLESAEPGEGARLLGESPPAVSAALLGAMAPAPAAAMLLAMPEAARIEVLSRMEVIHGGRLLSLVAPKLREAMLEALPSAWGGEVRLFLDFPADSVGALMEPPAAAMPGDLSVAEAVGVIRAGSNRDLQSVYVTDRAQRLIGVLSLQDLLLAQPGDTLRGTMRADVTAIHPLEKRDVIVELFERSHRLSMPVTDMDGVLLGEVRTQTIVSASQAEVSSDMLKMVGAGGDERVHSSVWFSVRKRLPWLQINLVTAFMAAAVVGLFEDTIARYTALAVLLPVVAGQSGNTGSQSLAVVMRGLALRDARPSQWFRIGSKEVRVGFLNGLAVAATTCAGVYLWSGSLGLVLVMALSMVLSMCAAAASGALIPIVLSALDQDPAQSASIVLTTVTDVVGFFSFLGLATVLARYLGGL